MNKEEVIEEANNRLSILLRSALADYYNESRAAGDTGQEVLRDIEELSLVQLASKYLYNNQ